MKPLCRPGVGFAAWALCAVASAAEPTPAVQFKELCGMCHQTNGMGVGLLARRPGDTTKGMLEARADLSAAFVKVVVRNGVINMPRISRGEVSDPQLDAIANYLSRGKP